MERWGARLGNETLSRLPRGLEVGDQILVRPERRVLDRVGKAVGKNHHPSPLILLHFVLTTRPWRSVYRILRITST